MKSIHFFLLSFFFLFTQPTFSQEFGCAMTDGPAPPTGPIVGVRQTCNSYGGSNDFFMPTEDSDPVTIKVNFIFVTDTDPNELKNFDPNNSAHMEFVDFIADKVEWRIASFNAFCPQDQVGYCIGHDDGCCSMNDPNAATCPCDNCVDLRPDWIGDSNIRFDVTKHWIADPLFWNNDPNANTSPNSNCSGGGNNYICPTGTNWYLHNFDLNVHDNCNVQPPVPKGINVYFTTDGDAYQDLVVNQNSNTKWCELACASSPSESDYDHYAREHMPNVFLKYYKFKDSPNDLNNIRWEFARSIVHEIGHTLLGSYPGGGVHNDGCSCYLMKTQSCGTKNMITEYELKKMHRTIALSNVRKLVKCNPLASYEDDNPQQDVIRITSSQVWDFDMKVFKHIVVETGATLTVSCRLIMPQGGQIIVKRGAELVVDGGIITHERSVPNSCGDSYWKECEEGYWRGIEVWGRAGVPQAYGNTESFPGVVRILNDALIENATNAITTKRRKADWPTNTAYWGGIVIAENSSFKNNLRSVEFMKYDFPNLSRFENCSFRSTDKGTWAGVTMWGTKGILFETCLFDQMGQKCIGLLDASASIFNSCSFSNTNIGVEVISSMPLNRTVNVGMPSGAGSNYFSDLDIGVFSDAGKLVGVYHNDFVSTTFGVFASGDSWFDVTGNSFNDQFIGVYTQQAEKNPNLTLCNTYNDVRLGVNIEGKNSGFQFVQENYDDGSGAGINVQIRSFFDPFQANNAIKGSVLNPQGYFNAPVFNLFSTNGGHIIADPDDTDFFYYFHPSPFDPRLKPACDIDDGCPNPNFFRNLIQPGNEAGCLSEDVFRVEGCPEHDIHCLETLHSQISTIQQLIAEGNKESLFSQLNTDPNDTDTHQSLLHASPYLSDSLLEALLNNS